MVWARLIRPTLGSDTSTAVLGARMADLAFELAQSGEDRTEHGDVCHHDRGDCPDRQARGRRESGPEPGNQLFW